MAGGAALTRKTIGTKSDRSSASCADRGPDKARGRSELALNGRLRTWAIAVPSPPVCSVRLCERKNHESLKRLQELPVPHRPRPAQTPCCLFETRNPAKCGGSLHAYDPTKVGWWCNSDVDMNHFLPGWGGGGEAQMRRSCKYPSCVSGLGRTVSTQMHAHGTYAVWTLSPWKQRVWGTPHRCNRESVLFWGPDISQTPPACPIAYWMRPHLSRRILDGISDL